MWSDRAGRLTVTVRSTEGYGSTFTLRLPAPTPAHVPHLNPTSTLKETP